MNLYQTNSINLKFNVFESISKNGNGGIIEAQSVKITITCCQFTYLSSTETGGCLTAFNSHLFLKNSQFETCRVLKNEDQAYGNAIFMENEENNNQESSITSKITEISHSRCGSEKTDGDSAIFFYAMLFKVSNLNSSFNTGTEGSSLFSSYHSLEGSFVDFSQNYNSSSAVSIESAFSFYICKFTNFLNTKQ